MSRPFRLALPLIALAVAAGLAACGESGIQVAESSPSFSGAYIFSQRCAGCHTLQAAGTQGSASNVRRAQRNNGPNLDQRKEDVDSVLYAIRNGGFSGAIMPQNIAVGAEADAVAEFVSKYAGKDAKTPKGPDTTP